MVAETSHKVLEVLSFCNRMMGKLNLVLIVVLVLESKGSYFNQ